MVEVTLLKAVATCLFVVVVYLLEAEFLVVVRIILESVLNSFKPIRPMLGAAWQTFMASSSCLFVWYCRSSAAHDSNTLGTSADEYITLSKSEYNSLLKKDVPSLYFRHYYLGISRYFLFSEFITFILNF